MFGVKKYSSGFTITELVVVIAVIAILASMSIMGVSYWRSKVASTEVKNDLNSVKAAMESSRNFSDGYPLTLPSTVNPSTNVQIAYDYGDASSYCVNAHSSSITSVEYHLESSSGEIKEGACPPQAVPLTTPAISAVNVTGSSAAISWSPVTGATGYDIQRQENGGAWTTIPGSSSSSYTVSGLPLGAVHQFKVRAKTSSTTSDWSTGIQRVTIPTPTIDTVVVTNDCVAYSSYSWVNANVTWTAAANTFATSYTAGFTHTTSGPSVTSTPKSVTNTLTGSGQLSTSTSSNKWWAQDPFTPSIQVVGIGANGERSSTATWQGRQYSPLEC